MNYIDQLYQVALDLDFADFADLVDLVDFLGLSTRMELTSAMSDSSASGPHGSSAAT